MNTLEWWNGFADDNSNAINSLIENIRMVRNTLDNDIPEYLNAYTDNIGVPIKYDQRREIFSGMISIYQYTQLSYINILHNLSKKEWWEGFSESGNESEYIDLTKEYSQIVKITVFNSVFVLVEDFFRLVVRSGNGTLFTISPTQNLKNIYDHVLNRIGLSQYIPLFDILRNTRNTIHNNGYYISNIGNNLNISYEGKDFEFRNLEQVDFVDEKFLLEWLPFNLCQALFSIVMNADIKILNTCSKDLYQNP